MPQSRQGSGPVLDALFADSVATGGRETIYTAAQIASLLSRAVGPLLSALLFERGGNTCVGHTHVECSWRYRVTTPVHVFRRLNAEQRMNK